MAKLGLALREAVPQTLSNIGAIEDIRASAQQRRANEFTMQQAQAEQQRLDAFTPINIVKEGMPNATQSQVGIMDSFARQLGMIETRNGVEGITMRNRQQVMGLMAKDPKLITRLTRAGIKDTQQTINQIDQIIKAGGRQEGDKLVKLKPEEEQNLQRQKQSLNQRLTQLTNFQVQPERKPFVAEDPAERISRELFDRGFEDLSQSQQAVVNKRFREEKETRAGLAGGITPTVQSQIQKDIIAGEKTIGELDQMSQLFNREFLEFKGQGIGAAQKFFDKLGQPEVLGKDVRQFAKEKSAFVAQSKAFQNAYRKWVTGVAGGEKEFSEILKAIPDVDRDGPDMYESKLEQTKRWSAIVSEWLKSKNSGIPISISEVESQLIEDGVIGTIGEEDRLTPEEEAERFLRGQ